MKVASDVGGVISTNHNTFMMSNTYLLKRDSASISNKFANARSAINVIFHIVLLVLQTAVRTIYESLRLIYIAYCLVNWTIRAMGLIVRIFKVFLVVMAIRYVFMIFA